MDKPKFKEFKLPKKILTQLYELTGGAEAYKGFIIAYSDENGTPIIYTSCDSKITESGLIKSMEDYINDYSENLRELDEEVE